MNNKRRASLRSTDMQTLTDRMFSSHMINDGFDKALSLEQKTFKKKEDKESAGVPINLFEHRRLTQFDEGT